MIIADRWWSKVTPHSKKISHCLCHSAMKSFAGGGGKRGVDHDHCWLSMINATVDYRRFNIDRLATQKNQRWKSSSSDDQHIVNDDLWWSKWWFFTDPMINIDLNISTVQLIDIASTLIIGKIKDHHMIILESSMINVDIFSKILGICHCNM